jgi:hypothetical protein
LTLGCGPSFGWGNEGHEIVATVAANVLQQESPGTLKKVNNLLAKDTNNTLTPHDIASEATWADEFRQSSEEAQKATEQWHFVDTDFDKGDMSKACPPASQPSGPASQGAADDCVTNKIAQFAAELKNPQTPRKEKILALKFLLHFVGDVHQPLHAISRTDPQIGHPDRGGNCVGILRGHAQNPTRLHSYWDTALVKRALHDDVDEAATALMDLLTPANRQAWDSGEAADWARESFKLAKTKVYAGVVDHQPEQTDFVFTGHDGHPDDKCGPSKVYRIDADSDTRGVEAVKEQLAKAGLRLARLLENAM